MVRQMAGFPVDGDEGPRLHQPQQQPLVISVGMARDVDAMVGFLEDVDVQPGQLIDQTVNRDFIPGNEAGREHHPIAGVEMEASMGAMSQTDQTAARFPLSSGREDADLARLELVGPFLRHQNARRQRQPLQGSRELDVLFQGQAVAGATRSQGRRRSIGSAGADADCSRRARPRRVLGRPAQSHATVTQRGSPGSAATGVGTLSESRRRP